MELLRAQHYCCCLNFSSWRSLRKTVKAPHTEAEGEWHLGHEGVPEEKMQSWCFSWCVCHLVFAKYLCCDAYSGTAAVCEVMLCLRQEVTRGVWQPCAGGTWRPVLPVGQGICSTCTTTTIFLQTSDTGDTISCMAYRHAPGFLLSLWSVTECPWPTSSFARNRNRGIPAPWCWLLLLRDFTGKGDEEKIKVREEVKSNCCCHIYLIMMVGAEHRPAL